MAITTLPKVSELQLLRSVCRESYSEFVREFWPTISAEKLKWNWHMDVLCDELQEQALRVWRGEPKAHDTVINISPGTSKSSLCSVLFPPWVWTFFPAAQFICPSYSHPLALDLSNKSRDVVKSEKYRQTFPKLQLRPDQDTKGYFKNTMGGYRYAVGSGGSVLGMHGHFIIIDDPLDPTEAVSEVVLAATNHWIKHTLRGRKVDKRVTVTVLVMQRLHQDDPSAQMTARANVRHLRIPAELSYKVSPSELSRFYRRGLMDPTRLPWHILEEERSPKGLGEYGYAGQYGQDPVPAGGGMFKTDKFRPGVPPPYAEFKRFIRYWDKAATEAGGAYTVGLLMGLDREDRVWVLDVLREQKDTFAREKRIRRTALQDTRRVIVGLEQEGGSGGKDSALGTVRRLRGFRVRLLSPKGDKEVRADEFSVQVNGGNVWLPRKYWTGNAWTGWAEEYVEELKHFPHSTFKDQVDASSGAFTLLTLKHRKVGAIRRREAHKNAWLDD